MASRGVSNMSDRGAMSETKSAKGAATRDQILDAASRLISFRGYHCSSLDDVLRESGVGKGNFYYYFKSKEDLGYAIIDRLVHGFAERTLEPAFADAGADPVAQIHEFLDRILENQRQRNCVGGCPMGNLASELSDVHEGFRKRLAGIFLRWRIKLTDAIGRGQATGRIRPEGDAAALAQFIVAALEGAILLTKVTKDISVMEQCVAHLKHHLTLYTRSRPADDERVAGLVQGRAR
jgi:TetR/AcrR family transcriptional repressor of nem operon